MYMKNSNKPFALHIAGRGLIYLIYKYLLHLPTESYSKEMKKRFQEKNQFKEMLNNINNSKIVKENKITICAYHADKDEKCK